MYRIKLDTGAVDVLMDDPLMKPIQGSPVGLDGLQVRDNSSYYTNFGRGLFVRVPLQSDGTAAGAPEVLLRDVKGDDFT